jgi:hypothetical protein
MNDQVKITIRKTVLEMLNESISKENINRMTEKHIEKVHFIPIRYRILGGILQGLNIKFGNFIEQLISNLVEIDANINVMPDSGKKIRLFFTPETDALIDSYITHRQLPNSPDDCTELFDELLNRIIEIESKSREEDRQGIVKDVDGLFQTKDGLMVYTELKYNDDHDTGKFADINRKFIKTWAGLAVHLKIKKTNELFPIIYYFNSTKRYGPIHTPSRNIMRGPQLFETFLQTKYDEVDQFLSEIGDDPDILNIFDELYVKIRNMKIGKSPTKLI